MAPLQFSHPGNAVWLLLLPCIYVLYKTARVHTPRSILCIRALIIGLLTVSLSGVQIRGQHQGSSVVFVLDHSDSISHADRAAALAYINRVTSAMTQHDQAGLVVFGKEAFIEQPFGSSLALTTVHTTPAGASTHAARALRLAMAMLEPHASKRIVLLSDGNQNTGDAVREARIAAARGITIDVVPLGASTPSQGQNVRIEAVTAPSRVRIGEPFDVEIVLQGDAPTQVVMKLYHNGTPVAERRTTLTRPGRMAVHFPQRHETPGFHRYTSVIENAQDPSMASNENGAVIYVVGQPKVLYVTETSGPNFLTDILTGHDFAVDLVSPTSLPAASGLLSPYDAVIFDDVPASTVTPRHMQAIADYVEQSGGGFMMTGGTNSFGPGGYAQTPLERILPVDMRVRRREKRPQMGLVLLLDKSGSMAAIQREKAKITVAKEAVRTLRNLLFPEDTLGIIAFDRHASVLLPLGRIGDKVSLDEHVDALQARGGTQLYPALDMAYHWLQPSRIEKKQVLLISDGRTVPADFPVLVGKLAAANIALSVVGLGSDADRTFLTELATRGKGRAYFTHDMAALSTILQREAGLVAGQWVHRHRVKPQAAIKHEVLRGIEVSAMPEIEGYIASTPKPLASVLLASDQQDPLLACWRFGLGKTLVFTSDLSASWTTALTAWEDFGALWTHMVRWTSRGAQSDNLHPRLTVNGDTAHIMVDAFDTTGRFLNFLDMRATIATPDAQTSAIHLAQTASGRYEGHFPAERQGTYVFSITASGKSGQPEDALHFGVYLSTPQEHRTTSPNLALLREIAGVTHGSLLTGEATPFRVETPGATYGDAWHLPAFATLFLFLIEVAWRRGFSPKYFDFATRRPETL